MTNPKGNVATLKSYQPAWNSGATKTVRVPIVLADKVIEYARSLDTSDSDNFTNHSRVTTERVKQAIEILNHAVTLKANAGGAIKAEIRRALDLLSELNS